MQWQTFTERHPESTKVSTDLFDAWFEALKRAPMEWDAAVFSCYNIHDGTTDFYFAKALRAGTFASRPVFRDSLRTAHQGVWRDAPGRGMTGPTR